ncbi:hypothetical protein C6558_27295 [Ensifer sp. NM-2]|jgi:hypothetical protein|uniref:hypothetical protein n=1 Tax=unclassified Ensifer TaxID=2633371 RepID=UPI00070EBB68|nr:MULTISPECIES: hypothetical protein [unclassified Ensifer]KQW78492.1 hypothetical protein ASD03_25730 [Ensifer sp. Root127]PSS61421.1 hypothetical protein C6558_27295 [Ensifer sp. NM-2]
MSSSHPEHYLDADDLSLLVEVLTAAGFYGTTAKADPSGRLAATRFLMTALENGINSRERLTAALVERGDASSGEHQTPQQTKAEAIDRWDDEGGAISSVTAKSPA